MRCRNRVGQGNEYLQRKNILLLTKQLQVETLLAFINQVKAKGEQRHWRYDVLKAKREAREKEITSLQRQVKDSERGRGRRKSSTADEIL